MINYGEIVFIDTEVSPQTDEIMDYGAISQDGMSVHCSFAREFADCIKPYSYICGHNIIEHDLKYIQGLLEQNNAKNVIDTLYLSPLLFPKNPYHALLKDDKLQVDELNNPLNDAKKCMDLFFDEVNAFEDLNKEFQQILVTLLWNENAFKGFWSFLRKNGDVFVPCVSTQGVIGRIKAFFKGKICENADMQIYVEHFPKELAYCLALINVNDHQSVIPHWVHVQFPIVEVIMRILRGTPCKEGCAYCKNELDVRVKLNKIFKYDDFRKYEGEPLQENAVRAAMEGKSLIAIFPTGGGKSLTFQLPALIQGEAVRGLTVVISPLQSLMKDQVDNLEKRGIVDAVTINGMLSPLERAEAIHRVESGIATILYISPEQLRSKTIERILLARHIVRFVIDEAHCFSAWGQDFRVEYLYIGEFIRELQEKKRGMKIPVSCFTATAKQKVISDIKDYFHSELGMVLDLYATNAMRTNLRYEVIHRDTDEEKYVTLRNLIEVKKCPTIVYVSRVKKTYELAERLCSDGFRAKPYNGKMEAAEKAYNQEAFIKDEVQVIVATSAFGMGVDKSNVKLVIHYDISDSLENYVQEAGRAGRNPQLQAECYILYNDNDLDKHFLLLNQTKLSISEIQQVWRAIKDVTKERTLFRRSPLEIARQAGWDDGVRDIETRVKTAIMALEKAGYIKRGKNVPHVYATSIKVANYMEAAGIIDASMAMDERMKQIAKRIMQLLISKRSIARAENDEAESRTDYIADILGLSREDTQNTITKLREIGVLEDCKDLTAYIYTGDRVNKTLNILNRYIELEKYFLGEVSESITCINLKELNDRAIRKGLKRSSVNVLKTILYFWSIKGYLEKTLDTENENYGFVLNIEKERLSKIIHLRQRIATFIAKYLYNSNILSDKENKEQKLVGFSEVELKNRFRETEKLDITTEQVEDALLYLSKIGAMMLEDGFLVLYSSLEIKRLELDNRKQYKAEDYKYLNEYYGQKMQQIHIVGEYANIMARDYNQALEFVKDYFQLDYKVFIKKYFEGDRVREIQRNITPEKYNQLFGKLSEKQLEIVNDNLSQYIVVAAGPGSGKTRVLVHKLASLLLLEDVKHEQLLMVTFSRAAAIEFKQRLYDLIGNGAGFVEIKTFHSYCFDLMGQIGNIETAANVVREATRMINDGEVELGKITKGVLVIDEAQDMDIDEYNLICALMNRNENMRVIAVGDDDQNIYDFRGSDSKYMQSFITEKSAQKYELVENYRSAQRIVAYANRFAKTISNRMKLTEIRAVHQEMGEVKLFSYTSTNIETPVVNDLLNTCGEGTACVLTNTNEEALKVLGLLKNKGIKAQLIQSNDGFALYDLIEIRFFMNELEKNRNLENPIIDDDIWKSAKIKLLERYSKSECLQMVCNILGAFEHAYSRKYYSDLYQYIKESKLEDFYKTEKGLVHVSTIHKAKGREYDYVYMMLKNEAIDTDSSRRKIYVGITRAKRVLHIHYNRQLLENVSNGDLVKINDTKRYDYFEELISQLTHRDIVLSFVIGREKSFINIQSGMPLEVGSDGVYLRSSEYNGKVAHFSKKYLNEISRYYKMGYRPASAKVRFVVAWKNKDEPGQHVLILPDITYRHI